MTPLAVSGPLIIGVAVIGPLILLRFLLRAETRMEAEEEADARGGERP